MTGARRKVVVALVAISFALLAQACGRYGPPVRALPSHPTAADREPVDNTRDEVVPYVLEGLREPETEPEADPATPEDDRNTKPPE